MQSAYMEPLDSMDNEFTPTSGIRSAVAIVLPFAVQCGDAVLVDGLPLLLPHAGPVREQVQLREWEVNQIPGMRDPSRKRGDSGMEFTLA